MNAKKLLLYFVLLFFVSILAMSCHEGVGCPNDQYNDWKKIEARRKQQLKNPGNPNKSKKSKKTKTVGNGVVPN